MRGRLFIEDRMIEVNDILHNGLSTYKVIDAEPDNDYVVALLQSDIDGPIDQDEDNIGEFILREDIAE